MAVAHRGSVRLFGKMIQVVTGDGEEEEDNRYAHADDGGGGCASAAAFGFGKQQETLRNQGSTTESRVQQGHEYANSKENPSKSDINSYKEEALTVESSIQKEQEQQGQQQGDEGEEEEEEEEENGVCKSDSQEKTLLKKPDKILPCPRCNSQDTKFCYFNNYNVNQPRYFCRNCQRYWTAGGTMRNMPVGSGRRKNKSASSFRYQRMTLSELGSLQAIQSSVPELVPQTNGTVLSFGSDRTSCESSVLVQNAADNNTRNSCRNGDGDEHSNGSVVSGLNSYEKGRGTNLQQPSIQNYQPLMPCFSVPPSPWIYTWNQASTPVPYYPVAPYWGYAMPNPENSPWLSPQITGAPRTSGLSPHLGKHSRDENISGQKDNADEPGETCKQGALGRCLPVPIKKLTIDDPEEAAKSSVWLTMDLKKHKGDWINGGGLFKAFQPKALTESHLVQNLSEVNHHHNPAAWSRSVSFREGL